MKVKTTNEEIRRFAAYYGMMIAKGEEPTSFKKFSLDYEEVEE